MPVQSFKSKQTRRYSALLAGALAFSAFAMPAMFVLPAQADPINVPQMTDTVTKSLVMVEYTLRNENISKEESGQGIVLNKDGVILISGGLIPEMMPKEYIKDIKVRIPGKQYAPINATFLGRTTNRLFAFVKAEKPIDAPPLDISKTGDIALGQEVTAFALQSKGGGYEPYVGIARIKAIMHIVHDIALTQSFGLTRATSPVYDQNSGALVGIVFPALGEGMTLHIETNSVHVELKDEDQSAAFLPWAECKDVFADVPTKPFEARRPWMGIDGITGVEEDVRTLYAINQPAGVTVGSVVPGEAADKAGLKGRDIILTMNDKEFSTSTVPEYMVSHFQRLLERMKIGDEIKLGILRDGKPMDIKLKLSASPRLGAEMPHVFNPKLGITTRDLVFSDAYARKLPQDQKGVIVALVKQGSAAGIGSTPLHPGHLITQINGQEVSNEKQFEEVLKAATDDADKKEIVFSVIEANGVTTVCRIDLSK